jgi:hypothetical protein
LGLPLEFKPDNYGLLVRSAMNLDKQIVKDVYSDYKFFMEHDRTLEHSIGYRAIKYNIDEATGIRSITEYKLLEYSTLSFLGANENTPCVGIKSEELVSLQEEIKMLDDMLHNGSYSDEKFLAIEKRLQEKLATLKNEPIKVTQKSEPSINYIQIINNLKIK